MKQQTRTSCYYIKKICAGKSPEKFNKNLSDVLCLAKVYLQRNETCGSFFFVNKKIDNIHQTGSIYGCKPHGDPRAWIQNNTEMC